MSAYHLSSNLFPLIAERIAADPALLDAALATARHWLKQGLGVTTRLERWCVILEDARHSHSGLERLLFLLRDESEDAIRLKEFAPFAGILSREDRRRAFRACA